MVYLGLVDTPLHCSSVWKCMHDVVCLPRRLLKRIYQPDLITLSCLPLISDQRSCGREAGRADHGLPHGDPFYAGALPRADLLAHCMTSPLHTPRRAPLGRHCACACHQYLLSLKLEPQRPASCLARFQRSNRDRSNFSSQGVLFSILCILWSQLPVESKYRRSRT